MPDFQGERGSGAARRDHFVVGDPIRGLAALLVFAFHAALAALFVTGRSFDYSAYVDAFGSIGAELVDDIELAVYAFFVLSGYLIGRPFVAAYLRGERGPSLRVYARRRVMRILPAFLLVVTLALIRFGSIDASAGEVVGVYALLQAYDLSPPNLVLGVFGHLWTVQVEMGFYLLLPVAIFVLAKVARGRLGARGRLLLLLGLCAAVVCGSLLLRHLAPHTVAYSRWLPAALFAFMPGVALAAVEDSARARLTSERLGRLAVLSLLLVAVGATIGFGYFQRHSPALVGGLGGLAASAFIAAALANQWAGRRPWRMLDNRPLHWIGQRSYSLYLVHVPVLWDLQGRLKGEIEDPKVAFAVILSATFVISATFAALAFRYVEWPAMRAERWPWQRRRPPAAIEPLPAAEPALSPER